MVWGARQEEGGGVRERRKAHTSEAAGAGQSGGACRGKVGVSGLSEGLQGCSVCPDCETSSGLWCEEEEEGKHP